MAACVPICGIGAHLTLSNAHVDPSYTCPNPSDRRPYDVHTTIDVDNYTGNKVTIRSISEADLNFAVHGSWSGSAGTKGGGDIKDFKPTTINAGDKTQIKFGIGFECTNSGPTDDTYGDFSFKFTVVTSGGTFHLDAVDTHRLQIQKS